LLTRERRTLITLAELVILWIVVFVVDQGAVRLLVGVPLFLHVGYLALTSLPMGEVPRRPDNARKERRNQDLRSRIVGFLNEVRRAEDYAHRARVAGWPEDEVQETLRLARERAMRAAAAAVKVVGRRALAKRPETEVIAQQVRMDTNPFRLEA
jgi:hypothetical protein